jgi:site-specific DNA-methyltransferase (adenine-specific)
MGCELSREYNEWAIQRIEHVPDMSVEEWIALDRQTAARRESIR